MTCLILKIFNKLNNKNILHCILIKFYMIKFINKKLLSEITCNPADQIRLPFFGDNARVVHVPYQMVKTIIKNYLFNNSFCSQLDTSTNEIRFTSWRKCDKLTNNVDFRN